MIESKLKADVLKFLEDKKVSEDEKLSAESALKNIEDDLEGEFEKLVDRFKSKIGDIHEKTKDYKDEIIKKAMENLVKSL